MNGNRSFSGFASLDEAGPEDISFLGNPKYARHLDGSRAGLVLLPGSVQAEPEADQVFLHTQNPSLGLALIAERVERALDPLPEPGIHPSAVVDPAAEVDAKASIGPLCVVEAGARIEAGVVLSAQVFIGRGSRVGAHSRMHAQSVLHRYCEIGQRCLIHSGAVIGADGFGFETTPGGHVKVPQVGTVLIADDVEIGANSTLDRARLSTTRVGRGTKIDNLVQVGHNVTIGEHCFLCAGVGIAGSTKIGNFVVLGGQAGTAGHITIGDYAQVGGQGGVSKDVAPKSKVTGTPARDFKEQRRLEALVRRLPQLFQRVRSLEGMSDRE